MNRAVLFILIVFLQLREEISGAADHAQGGANQGHTDAGDGGGQEDI